jgi:hypothetical protein
MKIIVGVIIILCVSCTMTSTGIDPREIIEEIYAEIRYKKDIHQWGVRDYWQSREVTQALGTGDCEDYCIYAMEELYDLGQECRLVCVKNSYGNHMIVQVGDIYYDIDGETKDIDDYKVWYRLDRATVAIMVKGMSW